MLPLFNSTILSEKRHLYKKNILASLFERDLIRERTNAGLAAAKARGRVGGRPRKLQTNGKVALARRMFADQSHSIPEICAALGISRATLYRYVREAKEASSSSDS
jgi:DNA invertase Pin-like site-specific DNA recombinase